MDDHLPKEIILQTLSSSLAHCGYRNASGEEFVRGLSVDCYGDKISWHNERGQIVLYTTPKNEATMEICPNWESMYSESSTGSRSEWEKSKFDRETMV